MTCVGHCKLSDDRCDGLGVPESLRCEITLLGVPELVMNYELDKVHFVSVCPARLAVLVSCRVELTLTGHESGVYLGLPVLIYYRVGYIIYNIVILYMFNTQVSEQTGCTSVIQ